MYSSNSRQNGFRDLPRSSPFFPSYSRPPGLTSPFRRPQLVSFTPIFFVPLTRHTRPATRLRVNSIRWRAFDTRFRARPAENMAVGIQSGHYPTCRNRTFFFFLFLLLRSRSGAGANFPSVPKAIGLAVPPLNPALPPRKVAKIPSRFWPLMLLSVRL
ncbi:hypothetical protein EDB85DRAFT_1973567 [Lactarius pseudohatsudake]|nr:hypothetical protein EDB85DRAFT_1973567 [Lactarius pseudohatsudake]